MMTDNAKPMLVNAYQKRDQKRVKSGLKTDQNGSKTDQKHAADDPAEEYRQRQAPSQIQQAMGSFCCLKSKMEELKQGTEKVSMISRTTSCTASKAPLPAMDKREAELKSRFKMLSSIRLAASGGRCRNRSSSGR